MVQDENVSPREQGAEERPSASKRLARKHPVMMTVLIGLLAVALVYFGKEIQGKLQRKSFVKKANVELLENNKAMMRVLAKSINWSVRSEMLRGNMEQVNLLLSQLVKDSHLQYIHLLETKGNVLISTNKRLEGQPVESNEVKSVLTADSTVFVNEGDSVITVVSPVMGYDQRIGTLVLSYAFNTFK